MGHLIASLTIHNDFPVTLRQLGKVNKHCQCWKNGTKGWELSGGMATILLNSLAKEGPRIYVRKRTEIFASSMSDSPPSLFLHGRMMLCSCSVLLEPSREPEEVVQENFVNSGSDIGTSCLPFYCKLAKAAES